MYEQERPFDYPGSSQGDVGGETTTDYSEEDYFRLVILIEDEYGQQVSGVLLQEGEDFAAMEARLYDLQSALGGDLI